MFRLIATLLISFSLFANMPNATGTDMADKHEAVADMGMGAMESHECCDDEGGSCDPVFCDTVECHSHSTVMIQVEKAVITSYSAVRAVSRHNVAHSRDTQILSPPPKYQV